MKTNSIKTQCGIAGSSILKCIKTRISKPFIYCLLTFYSLLSIVSQANNVSITNTVVSGNQVRFTLSWDNSWRVSQPPYNYDAIWVFIKYAECTGGVQVWQHLTLDPDAATDSTNSGYEIKTSLNADGQCYGVYIQRKVTNTTPAGPASVAPMTVRLTFAAGVPPAGPTYNFRVYGIEMVYTQQGDFQIGDGASTSTFSSVSVNASLETTGAADASAAIGGTGTTTDPIPAAYPVGWNAFYCMKYEISQQEYVDFLNTLTYNQQASRTDVAPNTGAAPNPAYVFGPGAPATGSNRNGIRIQTPGIASTTPAVYGCDLNNNNAFGDNDDGQNVACNFLSWGDLSAFLDWAALRPMTELEYEKECRGTVTRLANEYPWGTGGSAPTSNSNTCNNSTFHKIAPASSGGLTGGGSTTEVSTNSGNGLAAVKCLGSETGPLRVGFAATASTTRITAGAGYYGAMDLAGNVWEQTINSATTAGLTYTGAQGDGTLSNTGDANTANWPDPATGTGTGARGGAWNTSIVYDGCTCCACTTSNRRYYYSCHEAHTSDRLKAITPYATRDNAAGGRGVRNP